MKDYIYPGISEHSEDFPKLFIRTNNVEVMHECMCERFIQM